MQFGSAKSPEAVASSSSNLRSTALSTPSVFAATQLILETTTKGKNKKAPTPEKRFQTDREESPSPTSHQPRSRAPFSTPKSQTSARRSASPEQPLSTEAKLAEGSRRADVISKRIAEFGNMNQKRLDALQGFLSRRSVTEREPKSDIPKRPMFLGEKGGPSGANAIPVTNYQGEQCPAQRPPKKRHTFNGRRSYS